MKPEYGSRSTPIQIRATSEGFQTASKEHDSIQARVIRELQINNYDIIFDDDGKGEAADVVTIRLTGDKSDPSSIEVAFYHCKFSIGAKPGKRIEDLYEVCGQAQKSLSWMSTLDKRTDLFAHLLRSRLKTPVSILSAKKKAQTQARLTL